MNHKVRNKINIGDKFNNLKVIAESGKNKTGHRLVKCLCDCGNEKILLSKSLRNGYIKSCGKCKKKVINIGERFNRLLVIGEVDRKIRKRRTLICLCDCGKEVLVRPDGLTSNKTKSCGCLRNEQSSIRCRKLGLSLRKFKINIGDVFNKLTVLEDLGIQNCNGNYNKRLIKCKCECGVIKNYRACHLVRTKDPVLSCGCSRLSKNTWVNEFNKIKKHSAINRNLNWELNQKQFETLVKSNCYYCNAKPSIKTSTGRKFRNGIDRVDNKIGYILNNCVAACTICNKMKAAFSKEKFLDKAKNINLNFKKTKIQLNTFNKENLEKEFKRFRNHSTIRVKRKLEWKLSLDEFKMFIISSCYYCGEIPNIKVKKGIVRNGIDRVDNDVGYISYNCVPCCGMCNRMKSSYDQELFINHMIKIYKHSLR